MSEMKWAIITGADGGMGTEITRAVAKAGYRIIMACYHPKKAEVVRERLSKETGNPDLEVMALDLSSMQSVISFVSRISERNLPIALFKLEPTAHIKKARCDSTFCNPTTKDSETDGNHFSFNHFVFCLKIFFFIRIRK